MSLTSTIKKKNNIINSILEKDNNNIKRNKPQLKKENKLEISKEEAKEASRFIFNKWKYKINYSKIDYYLSQDIYNQSKLRHECCNYCEMIEDFNNHYLLLGGELKGKIYNSSRDQIKNILNEELYNYSIKYVREKIEKEYKISEKTIYNKNK